MKYRCVRCGRTAPSFEGFQCGCGGLVEVEHRFIEVSRETFDRRLGCTEEPYNSGVWRYKELIHPEIGAEQVVTRPEGNTNLYVRGGVSEYTGIRRLTMKHEGENPTGSFKDRGMTVAVSEALRAGAETVVCASTGNTSASVAAYAAQAGLRSVVFVPAGEIALGKLAQALAYGARVIQVKGYFDDAMRLVREASRQLNLYVLNSLNPWRIEGQKSIVFEALQQMRWIPPDWIVVPAGNLGNTSAFGKALKELGQLGLLERMPRIAAVQAEGANPFYRLWKDKGGRLEPVNPSTVASAIKIGDPVSWEKALDAVGLTGGTVEQVSDSEILEAKAVVDATGVGCEPASAASVAGAKKLAEAGVIGPDEEVLCVLTGNILKDTETTIRYHSGGFSSAGRMNRPVTVDADLGSIEKALRSPT
ncbi:threonine synthase [Candidatus Bathyarchaeota archaeon RBG_13_60_20]|nr:MAG: threonine synthase [Candidatus Bathyarchaeota archaeon RBG_13_60_20]